MDNKIDNKGSVWGQVVLLLIVNFAAVGCGFVALVCGLFTGNLVVAAFPALLAFLLSAWQPWFPLLCLLPYGTTLAPFLSVPITLVVYRTLHRYGKLQWLRRLMLRFSPRTWGVALGGFLVFGVLVSYAGYKDVPPQNRQIPRSLTRLNKNFAGRYSFKDGYCYTLSSFLNTEFLWKVQVPRSQMPGVVKDLALSSVPSHTLSDRFWNQPPYWWQRPTGAVEEYTSGDFSVNGGESDGLHTGVVYDGQTETLYLWGKDNW